MRKIYETFHDYGDLVWVESWHVKSVGAFSYVIIIVLKTYLKVLGEFKIRLIKPGKILTALPDLETALICAWNQITVLSPQGRA